MITRLVCWWFGCKPDYQASNYGEGLPCLRCGADDCSYADIVGDTRHKRLKDGLDGLWFHLWSRWLPSPPCPDCGQKPCSGDQCVPF